MFFTIVSVYFIAILFSRWIQSLVFFSQKSQRSLKKYHIERNKLLEKFETSKKDKHDEYNLKTKLKYLNRPLIEQTMRRVEKFDPVYFELTEIFDYYYNKFDLFVLRDCEHYFDDDRNPYLDVTRSI